MWQPAFVFHLEMFTVVNPKCAFCAPTMASDVLWITVKRNSQPGNTALGDVRAKRDPDSLAGYGLSHRYTRGQCWTNVLPQSQLLDEHGEPLHIRQCRRSSVSLQFPGQGAPALIGAGQTRLPKQRGMCGGVSRACTPSQARPAHLP